MKTPAPSQQTRQQIVAEFQNGTPVAELARAHNTTAHHVRCCLKQAGIRPRTVAEENSRRGVRIDLETLAQLIDLLLSTTEIAERLGVSQPTVEMLMRRRGLRSKHGRGSKLDKNYFWNGGQSVDEHGYVLVKQDGHPHADHKGYVRKHRLVMEEFLGRYLEPNEVVHHKDGDPQNNAPGNLQLFQSNAEHLRHELTGKRPNYTPDGLRRMRENALRVNRRRYASNRPESGSDVDQSPSRPDHHQEPLGTTPQCP